MLQNFLRKVAFLVLFAVAFSFAGVPVDKPMNVTSKTEDVFKPYVEMAQKTFPEVKKKYLAGVYQKERRILQVQIVLVDEKGRREMPFVKVLSCKGDFFKGTINNDLRTVKGFAYGDTVSFMLNEIVNWVVQDSKGREEGNYVGKAIDAYQYKNVGIFFEIVFAKGDFKVKYMYSMVGKDINVDGILPQKVIDEAGMLLKENFRKKLREGNTFEENKPFYSYHVYNFVTQKFVEM